MLNLPQFLDAITINKATDTTWEAVISAGFDNLEGIRAMTIFQLSEIRFPHGGRIGDRARDIHESLHSQRVSALLDRAQVWLTSDQPQQPLIPTDLKMDLSGKNVVMTGSGPQDRKTLIALLKQSGAISQSAVSANTHFLICESGDSHSSKAKSARKLGIPVLSYSDVF